MRIGAHVPNCLGYGDPAMLADLAVAAEEAGWDGFFIWDALALGPDLPLADAQISLGAIAALTQRMCIGPLVSPLARRRPWKVARETASLDRLAPGRTVLGVGLGSPTDFEPFSLEPHTPRERAAALDDALELVQALLSGEPVRWEQSVERRRALSREEPLIVEVHEFLPTPGSRVPVWGAGKIQRQAAVQAKRPFRRAAKLDGLFPVPLTEPERALTPGELQTALQLTFGADTELPPAGFELVTCGPIEAEHLQGQLPAYAEVGVTWWLWSLPLGAGPEQARELLEAGPPRG